MQVRIPASFVYLFAIKQTPTKKVGAVILDKYNYLLLN